MSKSFLLLNFFIIYSANLDEVFFGLPDLYPDSTEVLVAPFLENVLSLPVADEEAGEKMQAVELADKNKDKKYVCSWPRCSFSVPWKSKLLMKFI